MRLVMCAWIGTGMRVGSIKWQVKLFFVWAQGW